MAKPSCVILGAGGHAKVVIDCLKQSRAATLLMVLDKDKSRQGEKLLGVPIKGGDELLPALARKNSPRFVIALGGIGDNRPRQRLFEAALKLGLKPLTVSHPMAIISLEASIGAGSVIMPGAIVNAGAVLGDNVIVNSGAIVEHDCLIGDHAHIATGAKLCSTVRVGKLAHIGAGAVIRQCLAIGEGAIIGAGAVVLKDVPAWTMAAGVPARQLKNII